MCVCVWWVHFAISNYSFRPFFCLRSFLLSSKLKLVGQLFMIKAVPWGNKHLQKFGIGMLYCMTVTADDSNENFTRFGSHSEAVQNFRKELYEFIRDCEGIAAWELQSDRLDKKKTFEIVGEIHPMIDKVPISQFYL